MSSRKDRVCPVSLHRSLDNSLRKIIHNPGKILKPFIKEGDTAIDIGCGPGFFTIPMAELTGTTGKTIAADLQQGMLDIIESKIKNTELEGRVILHKTEQNSLNLFLKADFILLFYMVHEVPEKVNFFKQIKDTLKDTGRVLLIEPPMHVTSKDFRETKTKAEQAGFKVEDGPKLFLDRTAVLKR
jgi:ubiquinone/menaquinone biosynthesis C-methylase UbiE